MASYSLTVKQLIKELKKMPQDLPVCFTAHDQNSEAGEVDGWANSVKHLEELGRVVIRA